MKLDQLKYIYNEGQDDEWRIEECHLDQTNLIVGKNASGKSRIVKAIYFISELLTENCSLDSTFKKYQWHLYFDINSSNKTEYLVTVG